MAAPEFNHSARWIAVASRYSPSTPPLYEEERQRNSETSTVDFRMNEHLPSLDEKVYRNSMPKIERTIADTYSDELYNPNFQFSSALQTSAPAPIVTVSPHNDIFTQRLQAANNQHLSASNTQTPLNLPSRDRSPFRQGSPLAPVGYSFQSQSQNVRFNTATQMRERQKAEADALALQQQIERSSPSRATPNTISPKDAYLVYHENDEDQNAPLFPQQQKPKQSKGRSNSVDAEHASLSQVNPGRRGVKGRVKGQDIWAFCDTGAGQNIIASRHAKQMGLKIKHRPTLLRMANSKQIFSPGIVRYPWAFSDDPLNVTTIVAHVLDDFKYDFLLGNPFLRLTQLMTKHIHRFVKGVFPSQNIWSLNLLGETAQRVQGTLGSNVPMDALPDIGSSRNVMDAAWAKSMGLTIRSHPENCGWIVFPDNSTRATIGQVRTTITLPGGQSTPIVFEVLPGCYVPVVLGEDFVFDNNLFADHAGAIYEAEGIDSTHDLLGMDFHQQSWYAKIGSNAKVLLQPKHKRNAQQASKPLSDTAELERQHEWDSKYQHGRIATQIEWNSEQKRRASHELRQYPSWRPNEQMPLIKYKPLANHDQGDPTISTSSEPPIDCIHGFVPPDTNYCQENTLPPSSFDNKSQTSLYGTFGLDEAALWATDQSITTF